MSKNITLANIFRYFARYFMLIASVLILLFALSSGVEQEGGLKGLINNSPNALPWLILLIIVIIAWKKELTGGILIILFGIAASIFFSIWNDLFEFVFFVALVIILMGIFFIISAKLRR